MKLELSLDEFNMHSVEQLYCQFTEQEVEKAIDTLKRGISGGARFC